MLDHGENDAERRKSKLSKKGKKKAELADLKKEIELVSINITICEHVSSLMEFVSFVLTPYYP